VATTNKDILDAVATLVDVPDWLEGRLPGLIDAAVEKFSRDRPRTFLETLTPSSAANLQPVPTSWEDGFSVILKIICPYTDEDDLPLDPDAYEIEYDLVSTAVTPRIRFLTIEPGTSDDYRVWYTRRHSVTDAACTVEVCDRIALANYVAHLVEKSKASRFNALKDQGGLAEDLVDYGMKATEARALAKEFLDTYRQLVGVSEEGIGPASVAGDLDTDPQYPFTPALTHHRRFSR